MYVPGKQYECLTLVTGVDNQRNVPFFLVDYPQGFAEAVADVENCRISFEYFGKDGLKYFFKTTGQEILYDEIRISFPEFIERIQRRHNFRIQPPLGTKILFNDNAFRFIINVIDISRGGALGALAVNNDGKNTSHIFEIGRQLKNLELVFPFRRQNVKIHVQEAKVIRFEKKPPKNRDIYAFQFTSIKKGQEKNLTDLIFALQRDFLRKKI